MTPQTMKTFLGLLLVTAGWLTLQETAPDPALQVDRDHVPVGRQLFRMIEGGEEVGSMEVHTAFEDGAYVIHDVSRMPPGIHEDVIMRFDEETFAPLDAFLSGAFDATHVHSQFTFEGSHVRGLAHRHRAEGKSATQQVDRDLPAGATLRGAALFLAPALPLTDVGARLELDWFAPLTAATAQVTFETTGIEQVTVPAGTFETYRVELTGGQPGNVLFITREEPHRTVRIDVVGRPMQIELVE